MRFRDLALLMLVFFIWAANVVIGKIVLTTMAIPPFYYASVRFIIVALALSPLLLPLPKQLGRILLVGLFVGCGHFGLLFLGLATSSPSSAAIVMQFGVPLTAILSVIFLKERISALRAFGIFIALAGVIIVVWNPAGLDASVGLLAVLASITSLSVGAILLKKLDPISPLRLQAWVGLVSFGPLAIASAFLENNQWQNSLLGGWAFVAALLFSAFVVTAWAHTTYFALLQKYEANLIAPLTLAMPIMTIGLGVAFTGDRIDARMLLGSALAIFGIAIVLLGQRFSRRIAVPAVPEG